MVDQPENPSENIFTQIFNKVQSALSLASDLERHVDSAPGLTSQQGNTADPLNSSIHRQLSFTNNSMVSWGYITDTIPYMDQYRVQSEQGGAVIVCSRLRQNGGTVVGAVDASSLAPGTVVYFIRHPRATQGYIIGAVPQSGIDPQKQLSDQITQASNCGLQTAPDSAYRYPADKLGGDTNKGISDKSSRIPLDQTNAGEWIQITDTGLAITLDSYMAQMRVDEFTGLFLYYWDQLCRLAGVNLQLWSGSGFELESYDDEGEHCFYKGIATYPWEAMAMLKTPKPGVKEREPKPIQIDEAWYTRLEPEEDNYQPFARAKSYGGYLGQGFYRILTTPYTKDTKDFQKYEDETNYTSLFEERITLAGHYALRTALGLTIGKRPVIPTPKRKKVVQDKKGDTAKNYKASSQFGDGDEHKCYSEIKADSAYPQMQRILGVLDLHTHIFNWEGPHPFYYHKEDYHYPQDSEMEDLKNNWEKIEFKELVSKQYLEPPEAVEVEIDHRTGGKAQIFPNSSSLTFLDDGGITLTDGFGSQIRMTGGNIHITAPGDVFVEAGRNATTWAGRDIHLRAKCSVDVTATDHDVRLKAEKNMQLLAANGGGKHGLLLESRSDAYEWPFKECGHKAEYSGIVLRAKDSAIINWSKGYYTKTLGSGWKEGIIFDANDGKASFGIRAQNFDRWCTQFSRDFFCAGTIEKNTTNPVGVIAWNGNTNVVGGELYCHDDIASRGKLIARSGVETLGYYFAPAGGVGAHIARLPGARGAAINTAMTQYNTILKGHIKYSDATIKAIDKDWYGKKKPGHKDTIKNGEFGLRLQEDYCTEGFILFESHWAQHARLVSDVPSTWTEIVVTNEVAPSKKTYPFPGKEKLIDEDIYYQQDWKFVTPEDGLAKDRPGEHEDDPAYKKPKETKLDGNYPIIDCCT